MGMAVSVALREVVLAEYEQHSQGQMSAYCQLIGGALSLPDHQ